MKPAPGVVGRCRCTLSLQKIGSGSAILAYKPARLLPPFRIFDFVLNTSPRQNANKFAFVLGLFASWGRKSSIKQPKAETRLSKKTDERNEQTENDGARRARQHETRPGGMGGLEL
jgi:hypothetical protein